MSASIRGIGSATSILDATSSLEAWFQRRQKEALQQQTSADAEILASSSAGTSVSGSHNLTVSVPSATTNQPTGTQADQTSGAQVAGALQRRPPADANPQQGGSPPPPPAPPTRSSAKSSSDVIASLAAQNDIFTQITANRSQQPSSTTPQDATTTDPSPLSP